MRFIKRVCTLYTASDLHGREWRIVYERTMSRPYYLIYPDGKQTTHRNFEDAVAEANANE